MTTLGDEPGVDDEHAPRPRRARRRLALAQIRQYPDSALRLIAHEVTDFDDDLHRLVDRMILLMHDAQGVGLAATQVGVLRRVFVFRHDDEVRAVVNPSDRRARRGDGDRRRGLPLAAGRPRAGRAGDDA